MTTSLTFSPPIEPSATTSLKPKVRKLVAGFGDGYTQRTPDGIKYTQKVYSLVWENASNADATTIYNFLESVEEITQFNWTDLDGNTNVYIASELDRTYDDYNNNTVKVTLTQDLNG